MADRDIQTENEEKRTRRLPQGQTARAVPYGGPLQARNAAELRALLDRLQTRCGLDFSGHLEQIYQSDTLHKTVEYMRKHR